MDHSDKLSRKAFLEAVEQHLAASSADDLRAILRTIAQETPPSGRRDFLARLGVSAEETSAAAQAFEPENLLDDIADMALELQGAMEDAEPDEYDEWGDDYDEEDSLGPYEPFIEPLAGLFDRAGAAFDHGDLPLARAAYAQLFDLLDLEDDYGRGIGVSDLAGVDAHEAVARYLRAIYETESPANRPLLLYGQMRQARSWMRNRRPMLDDVIEISPHPLPEQERFLTDWIAFLRAQAAPSGSDADAWLREAIRLTQGAAGLETLARAEGQTHPRAYLDWFTALEQEGQHQAVLTAAQEALQALPAGLPIRAAVADHLCAAALRLNDTAALRTGRWEAFAAKPTLVRLLDLWDSGGDEAERAALMARAAQRLRDYLAHPPNQPENAVTVGDDLEHPAWVGPEVLAHACLLAGDWDAAHQLAARGQVLGWSSSQSAQGLVVAAFLTALSGKAPGALSPNLAYLWRWGLANSSSFHEGEVLIMRLERAYAERFAATPLSVAQQKKLLSWCLDVAQRRVEAIVGNQRRRSYGKAAVLAVACAETLRLRGDRAAADALLSAVRGRFPRHSAFQAEMKSAISAMERGLR